MRARRPPSVWHSRRTLEAFEEEVRLNLRLQQAQARGDCWVSSAPRRSSAPAPRLGHCARR